MSAPSRDGDRRVPLEQIVNSQVRFPCVLDTQPSGDVTVTVSSDDAAAASVSSDGGATQAGSVDLTFTTANWDQAQTVTITGVGDDDTNDESQPISFAVAGHEYAGLVVGSLEASVTDTSVVGVTVSKTGVSMDEGASDSFTVVLDTQPSGDVTVTVSSDDAAAASVSSDGGATQAGSVALTFTTANWDQVQTVTITGVGDDDTSDESQTISFAVAGHEYAGLVVGSLEASVTDTSVVGVTVSKTGVSMDEGASDSFTVVLDTQPSGDVTVTVSSDDAAAASVSSDGGATQAGSVALTFTTANWDQVQTVTITGVGDDDTSDESQTISFAVAGHEYAGLVVGSLEASVTDTSVVGVTVSKTGVSMDEGASDSFTVVLDTQPSGDVTVTVSSDDAAAASVSSDGGATQAGSVALTFTTANWDQVQTVTITGVGDDDTNDESQTISFAVAGHEYAGLVVGSLEASVTDTSVVGVTVSKTGVSMDEGASDSFTVVLDTQPSGDVTVTVSSDDAAAASVSSDGGATQAGSVALTFTTANWDQVQTVTITGVGDDDTSDESQTISFAVAGHEYAGLVVGSLEASVTDTSVVGVTVSKTGVSMDEGASDSFTVVLDTQPSGDVTVTVSSDDAAAASVSSDGGATQAGSVALTFTTANWDQVQTVTITGVGDDDTNDESQTISFAVAGHEYAGLVVGSLEASVTDTSVVGVTVSKTGVSMDEGASDSFTVVLDTQPSGDVTVTVSSDDAAAASVSSDGGATQAGSVALTFTTANWDQVQTVTITGVGDDDTNDESQSISFAVAGHEYAGLVVGSLEASVTDTSVVGVTVSKTGVSMDEGASDSFTVVLDTQPSGDVTVTVSSDDAAAASVSSDGGATQAGSVALTFTTANWDQVQTVTITGVGDDDTSDESQTISFAVAGHEYAGLVVGSLEASVTDTSVVGVTVSKTGVSMDEGASDSFTVVLDTQPSGDVTVTVSSDDAAAASVSSDGGATQAGSVDLTFTTANWDQVQTVTITGVGDDDTNDESQTISFAVAGHEYAGLVVGSLEASVTDTSVVGVTVSKTGVSMDEGASDSFTVVLDTQPSGDVTVTVSSDDAAAASVSSDGGATQAGSVALTFTTANWDQAQTVTITGVGDDDTSDESQTISFAVAGHEYAGLVVGSLEASVTDTSVVGVTVSKTGVSMDEGASDSFTVVLDTQPSGDVTVTVSSDAAAAASVSSDGGATQAGSVALTFTTANWDQAQTVTITGVGDDDTNDESQTISFAVAGHEYAGLVIGSLEASVTDTSVVGVTVSKTGVSMDEGASDSFTVVLDTQPSGDVTVTVSSDDAAAASVSSDGGATQAGSIALTFTTSNWNTAQTVTVTGVSDDDSADESVSINLTPSGGGYGQDQAESLSVSVTDDDIPSLVLSVETLTISEAQTAEFTVALRTQPSGDVTVALATSEDEIVTLVAKADASDHVTFTTETWNTPQAVVATAVDNSILGNGSATLTLTAASTADADYNSLDPSQVSVSVEDDEVAGFVLSQSSLSLDEGTETSFTVALGGKPSQDVTVSLSSSNEAAATVTPASLTFTLTDWDSAQSVTLTSIDNAEAADVSLRVTLAASGAEFAGITQDLSVTIIDNDVQAQPEDSGALVSSIATSGVMSAQLGSLVSDAAIGGLSSAAGPAGTAPSPGGGSAASGDDSVASLDTSAYSRLHVLSAREGDQMPLVDWFSTGLSNASVDAELKGDGDFGYAVVGTELDKNETSVSGLLYGAEASSWNYEGETDVDRAGVSIGYYSARREGGLIYTGSSILTASRNEFESVSDATGNASSLRLILKGEISGWRDLEDGSRLTPFVDLLYSTETLESFKFSDGVSSDQAEASLGRLGLGVEYMTMPLEDMGRITLRGELSQVFGAEDVTLNDGTVYSPNEDPVGAISVGWIGNNDDGSTTRIDLTFGELGNGENEEVRIDGTWDRSF